MTQFYFALTNPEAETLLKQEVSARYPHLKLSYSRPGFLTYKADRATDFNPYMARVAGLSLNRFKAQDFPFPKAWVWKRDEEFIIPAHLQKLSDKSLFRVGEKVTLIMLIDKDEYWVGEYLLRPTHFQTPGEVSSIEKREVPSRAYYKIAEAHEAFDLSFTPHETALELGSAPGGASLFLLDQELKVIGVDPAEMDPQILKHGNFHHWRRPFETLTPESFKEKIDWIVSDVNLPPTVVLTQIQRLLDFLRPNGLILTLKLNQEKHLGLLVNVVDGLKKRGFKQVEVKYLPSHRQEVALIALR